ncbi:beta-lactamase family protein [Ectothiorhodospiraceae bacterium WFHF3C12]|nr:beta-lactamase family protein [Ectothiorhodospiraceae bacterium WFHF3C12]
MRHQVDREKLAGLSVLVHRKGGTAYFGTAGHMDREAGKPMTEDTIFRIYSMTKPVTSVAVMMLYEEGRFQLDDPIAKFIPELDNMKVMVGKDVTAPTLEPTHEPITIRQLLTHTAGLTYGFMMSAAVDAMYREYQVDFALADPASTPGDLVKRLGEIPLLCQPGSEWNYSVATDVLGHFVEVLSGQTLAEFFRERILGPLGMHDTAFTVAEEKIDRFAAMYGPPSGQGLAGVNAARDPNEIRREPEGGLKLLDAPQNSRFRGQLRLFSGGGGLTSTAGDYLRFCRMLLGGGELDGVRLLSRKTVAYMTRNHLPGDLADMGQPRFSETSYEGVGFGLGFSVMLDPAKAQIMGTPGEYAWGGAASTGFWIDPGEEMIVILMTQLMPSSTYAIRRELRVLSYQALID